LKKIVLQFSLILSLVLPNFMFAKGLPQSIQDDYAQGDINHNQYLVYSMLSLYDSEKLPDKYQHLALEPIKSSTFLRGEIIANWNKLSSVEKTLVEPYFFRPSLSDSLISPSGRFKIHYTTTGTDKTTLEYAMETAHTFDYCYQLEVEEMGFRPPPSDFDVDGPEHDVYIINVPSDEYGCTTPEQSIPNTNEWTCWIQVDNDFTHTYTKGFDGMRVTAAHEFFHMIHYGYRMFEESDRFFYEISGVWMEDVAFNDINDYYFYLPYLFRHPSNPFNQLNYGLSIWAHFISKKFPTNSNKQHIMRQIWERMPTNESLMAIEKALLEEHSYHLADALAEFAVWNCFTGENAEPVCYYEEGAHYPNVTPTDSYELFEELQFSGACAPLVAKYYKIEPKQTGVFSVEVNFDDPAIWRYSVVVQPFTGEPWFTIKAGGCNTNLGDIQAYSTIWIIPVNVKIPSLLSSHKNSPFTIRIEHGSLPLPNADIVSIAPNPFILNKHIKIEFRFRLARDSENISFHIFNENGFPVFNKDLGRLPAGEIPVVWDGRNEQSETVASGIYFFSINGEELLGPGKFAVIH
jgi:hypothetical protein